MAETTTINYGWTMPDPGASANTWGATLNATTQKVDNQVFQNQQGLVPIGSVTMFGGASPPANWLICDGSSLSTAAPYDKLFAAISTKFGSVDASHFNLPNLTDTFPIGVSATRPLAATGGAATVTLDATMIPAHTHTATQAAHTHSATQTAHSHNASQDAHTHNASQDPHNHGGVLVPGGTFTFGNPAFTSTPGRTDTQQPPVHIDAQQPAVHIDTQTPAITVVAQTPAITVDANTGGGAAHNNMPPWLGLNFIIRYL
jgi:microcystin-dependent protein